MERPKETFNLLYQSDEMKRKVNKKLFNLLKEAQQKFQELKEKNNIKGTPLFPSDPDVEREEVEKEISKRIYELIHLRDFEEFKEFQIFSLQNFEGLKRFILETVDRYRSLRLEYPEAGLGDSATDQAFRVLLFKHLVGKKGGVRDV